ncbi:EAL domain-containing protein [Gluconobacter thailandicus]|uniref:EAL domain-containing protein n=1 Tax=Gluconobacter thailandicus TaxID=257438 RepID=A0AAP9ERU8_GLUTH|nr:EAL domain-containing protein [Gluconobacter thailandicus]
MAGDSKSIQIPFLEYLKNIWKLFQISQHEENAPSLRHEQASVLSHVIWLFSILGISSSTLFTLRFGNGFRLLVSTFYIAIVCLYLLLIATSLRWRRDQNHDALIRVSIRILFVLGLVWGGLVNIFAMMVEHPGEEGAVFGLIMGLVSTPMLGVPIRAALAFFLPISLFCTLAALVTLQPVENVALLSFLGFLAFAFIGIVYMNKTFLERSIGRLNLQRQHETLQVFLREYEQVVSDWLWETDANGCLRNVTGRMRQFFHSVPGEIEGCTLGALGVQAEHSTQPDIDDHIRQRRAFKDLPVILRQGDVEQHLKFTGYPVHGRNGSFLGFRGVASDITEQWKAQNRIRYLAMHDDLTGSLSRTAFLEAMHECCAKQHPFALLQVDLDHFKPINDEFGHAVGDSMLKALSDRIRSVIGPDHLIGRLGGDEFAVLLHDANEHEAVARSQDIVRVLNGELSTGKVTLAPSVSIGIAVSPVHGETTDLLFRRSDLALYAAKEHRNICCLFENGMEISYFNRIRLRADLTKALERNEFFLDYQPIFDTLTRRPVSVEALVRWQHPTDGVVGPNNFIATAESCDLIEELGAYVLHAACSEAMNWLVPLPVAVNISPKQLRSGRLPAIIQDCLLRTSFPAERLVLEVTESVFLVETARTLMQLAAIRALGVRLVLDDFGTGYSSLTYLRGFDVDGIKVDASFTRDMLQSRKVAAIVRTIARLACDMNVYVVAEGVETDEQLNWLEQNGIAFAQGYLLGRPQSPEKLQALFSA